ncbi:MAG TPA: acyl-CoA dehydrogenase family protein [Chloroflexota bacterium]|nr:acyl-CoA dehydrogenase family protein [Chloroflexota bacterium]
MTLATSRSADLTRGAALIAAARDLQPRIAAVAEQIDRERCLPPDLVEALFDAGLFTMLLPASLGGSEINLPTFVKAVEEVARADASVAWCVGQANGLAAYMAYLDPAAARELYAGQRTILANGPGEGNRPGNAVKTDEGYRVTGRWMFASGIGHATWLLAICNLVDSDGNPIKNANGSLAERLLVLPKAAATLHDVWQVSGLRGTGSQSFSFHDVVVPANYVIHFAPNDRREPGPLYRYSNNGIFGPAFGSVALGIAHTSLVELIDFAGGKIPRAVDRSIRENPAVQAAVATAQARLGAARAYLQQTLVEVWDASVANGALDTDQRVAVRLAATHATQEAAAVVDTLYTLAGSHAIFESGPFARRFRDVHAVTQQLQARRAHYEHVGRYLLGLEPAPMFL